MFELVFVLTISLSHKYLNRFFFLINCVNSLYLNSFLSSHSFYLYINAFNCLNEENKGSQIISLSRFNFLFIFSCFLFIYQCETIKCRDFIRNIFYCHNLENKKFPNFIFLSLFFFLSSLAFCLYPQ
jgi:hypothetical protein